MRRTKEMTGKPETGMILKAAVLAGALCLAGAAMFSGAVETKAAEGQQVTVLLDWTPNTNHTGIYVARELGYYEQAGFDVDIQIPYAETATQLVATGKGDFGISNTEDTLSAISLRDPMPVKSVAAIIQHNTSGFVSLKETGIESPADWGGKTYGGYGGTLEEKVVRTIAENNGVDPDSIRFVDLGDTDTLTSLQNGIDFIWVFEAAELIGLQKEGVEYNYLPVRDYGDAFDYYTPVMIVNTNVAAADPQMVTDFVMATTRGYVYAIGHPEEAAEILLKAVPELDETIVKEGQKYLSERYAQDAPQWGWQDEEVWQKYADFMNENGMMENPIDVNMAFTNEYLPK